jgi:ADP-ribose pyrophosphatase YjhB (NUDIX family)
VSGGGGALASSFRFCPSCGAPEPTFLEGKRWLCSACGFEYFHNVAAAAGVVLERSGEILLLERAKEPRKGALGLPGGFVDPHESAEEAVIRECREEIGWAPPELTFIGSFPNGYEYGGVAYNTCDLFYYYRWPEGSALPTFALGDGESLALRFIPLSGLNPERLAFQSTARAIEAYRGMRPSA